MRIHAIETGRVRIKQAQIEGRGPWRQLQPMLSSEWAEWSPVYAWAIEHAEGVIVVDTGAAAAFCVTAGAAATAGIPAEATLP